MTTEVTAVYPAVLIPLFRKYGIKFYRIKGFLYEKDGKVVFEKYDGVAITVIIDTSWQEYPAEPPAFFGHEPIVIKRTDKRIPKVKCSKLWAIYEIENRPGVHLKNVRRYNPELWQLFLKNAEKAKQEVKSNG